jgi:hypothetical protein
MANNLSHVMMLARDPSHLPGSMDAGAYRVAAKQTETNSFLTNSEGSPGKGKKILPIPNHPRVSDPKNGWRATGIWTDPSSCW